LTFEENLTKHEYIARVAQTTFGALA